MFGKTKAFDFARELDQLLASAEKAGVSKRTIGDALEKAAGDLRHDIAIAQPPLDLSGSPLKSPTAARWTEPPLLKQQASNRRQSLARLIRERHSS
jgi:hypothetical protein